MIKRLFITFFLFCGLLKLSAQQYGNEWVNYNQQHFRINIPKNGLYRIDSTTLVNAGVPINGMDPRNFQLFIKGQEQYLYINGENDGVFNTTDYIEFYAEKNDGRFDSLAYTNITRLPNPYVALFNDTSYAFLTWNTSISNKRVTVETDLNFSGYTPTNYFYSEKVMAGNSYYSLGETFTSNISDPRYVTAEGYGFVMAKGQTIQTNFGNLNIYQSSSLPVYLKTSYSGTSQNFLSNGYDHQLVLDYLDNSSSYTTLNDTTFTGYKQFSIEKQITSDKLQNISTVRLTSANNPFFSAINNYTNLHYLYLKYPELPNFLGASEKIFFIDDNTSLSKTYIDIQNVGVGGGSIILYDLTNHKYISTSASGSNIKALIPNSGAQKKCFLTVSSNTINVSSMAPVNQNGYFIDYKTSNPDSAYLIVSHKGLQTAATDYKIHREGIVGGSNHVILAYIDELYDQFAYGNKKNPLAIKNFCRYLSDSLIVPPKYLLLLGKSIKNDLVRTTVTYWNASELPTMGIPASDNLLTTGIHGANSATPFIPVGRVSAKNNTEAGWYLNKVISHETNLPNHDEWRKRVLHFSGGYDQGQQFLFQTYLNSYKGIITDTLYGGQVFTFKKNSTAPIQINVSDSVKQLIDEGASIITFFGHASLYGFDQAIDDPTAYTNKDKYPLLIANSCYSGDVHSLGANSTSEAFTLIQDKGTIGFIASSSTGLVNTLYFYSSELYRSIAYERYYLGIGDAIKNSCYKNSLFSNQLQEITGLEMTLEGDPYIRLNAFAKPDYEIKNTSVNFNTTNYVDSIGINIKIKNLGKAIADTFVVRVERYFPSGDTINFLKKFKAPYNSDTLSFYISKDFENGIGLNHFKVFIDYYNEISELSESNNSTGIVDLFIPGGDVIPIYPYKYAIVPNTSQITLKASTADPFAPSANYKIQLDTNNTFVSPINSTIVTSSGGVIEWTVNLPFADSTVYFWRITKDSVSPTDITRWRESSFQVIGVKTGWAQAHFHQFKNDSYQFIQYQKPQRQFQFFNDYLSLKCQNGFSNVLAFSDIQYSLNNSIKATWHFAFNGWTIAVFDNITGQPWTTRINGASGYASPYNNCLAFANQDFWAYDFGPSTYCGTPTATWQTDLTYLISQVPDSSYILAYSSDAHGAQTYNTAMYNAFESFGSAAIHTTLDTVPMIIFGKKGRASGTAQEVIGINSKSVINLEDSMITRWNSGHILSEIIGPSAKWNSLHWKYTSFSGLNNDTVVLKIIRINQNGQADTVPTIALTNTTFDLYNLDTHIDANTYPYIQLVALMKDNVTHNAPQLKKWQVIYEPAPECAINPLKGYALTNDSLSEGDKLNIKLPIENIGTVPFTDSLLVTYWIEDNSGIPHQLPQKLKLKPFVPSQVIMDTISFNSYQYPGLNYLWVDVNPPGHIKYQNEQYHFNNIARIPFKVSSDKINPLLDVTFDGTHILNGDIISAKPHVLVTLKDENKFLALNDTSNFAVFIKYPDQAAEKRLYFANALQFTPAQLPNNSCKIEWKPELAINGKYTMIVQATDRSKNVSGSVDYSIQFEIETKQTITEVLNYPNPFSTSTRFVFTLTGSEVPDVFIIQIMTITGKVVREITKNELGNIRIGRNITQYAWDGKDEFGDKLGNGVYLYRVITRHNGEAIEKRQTDADSFFKKGIGKLVIMR